MGFRFEFDSVNQILLTKLEGAISDDVIRQLEGALRKQASEKKPLVQIVDCSGITKFDMSSELVRHLGKRKPPAYALQARRLIIAPTPVSFGLARMYQMAGEPQHASVTIVRSMKEALSELGIEQVKFEPLK
ncbi:MAG TPA: hypothetical protein VN682_16275 [Terriglobales bacterium]|nr:hypothetical protein [Terriglobales bacterium]